MPKFPLFLESEVPVRKRATALTDVEVNRVDAVAAPSTGRAFAIAKSAPTAIEAKIATLKSLGYEPNAAFYRLAKSGSINVPAVLDAEIARLSKSRVEKSAGPALGEGIFADVILPVRKAAHTADDRKDDEDEDSKTKAAADEDESDDMSDDERKQRGVGAKKMAAHRFSVHVQDADGNPVLHSTAPTRTEAMARAHRLLEDGKYERVAVSDAAYDQSEEESKSLRSTIERFKTQKGYARDAFLSGSISLERAFDLSEFADRGPRIADSGEPDALSRAYSEDVHARIAGPMSRRLGGDPDDRIPAAGAAGSKVVGDTRNVDYAPQAFSGDEGFYVGGEERPGSPSGPRPAGYGLLKEGDEPDTVAPIRVGENYLLPSEYTSHGPASARFPDADISLLKIRKSSKVGSGVFSNIVVGPEGGQTRFDQ